MKALWSRTGLSHRCGCRACDQVVQGAGRPTAKNVAAVRGRKPNYANRVAFYSSMLCTATIVDATRKDQRAHELDAEIKRVGNEVNQMKTRTEERLEQIEYARKHFAQTETTPCDANAAQNMILWDHMERLYVNLPAWKEIAWPPKLAPSNMIDDLRRTHYGVVDTATDRWSHARTQIDRITAEIKAEEIDPNVVQREPASKRQFKRKRDSVLRMVTGLLGGAERIRMLRLLKIDCDLTAVNGSRDYHATKKWLTDTVGAGWEVNPVSQRASQSYRQRLSKADNAAVPESNSRADEVLDEAWQLLDNNDTNWSFDTWNPDMARQTTLGLNAHIRWLFQQEDLPFEQVVGHICNNIMLSPFLPDIHTFNLLMAEFAKRREQKLFLSVYSEYLDSRMMSTPATQSINILAQTMFTSHTGLRRAIASVLGWDQRRGAKTARTEILPVRSNGKREFLHAMSPVYLPYRNSLISTLLSMHLFESAAAMFLACVRAHVDIGWEVIQRIFEAHIEALDWQGSMLLIRGVCLMDKDFGCLLKTLTTSEAETACRHLHSLLDFVGVHWTEEGEITMSHHKLEARGLDSSGLDTLRRTMMQFGVNVTIRRGAETGTPEQVAMGSRVLQLESIDKELTRVRKRIYTLEGRMTSLRRLTSAGADTLYLVGREHVKKTDALLDEFLKIQSNLDPTCHTEAIADSTRNAIRVDQDWLSKYNDHRFMEDAEPSRWSPRNSRKPSYDKPGYFPSDGIRMRSNPSVVRLTRDTPINRLEGWRTLPKVNWDPHAGSSIRALASRKSHAEAFAAAVTANLGTERLASPNRPNNDSKKHKRRQEIRKVLESADPLTAAMMEQRREMRDEGIQQQQQQPAAKARPGQAPLPQAQQPVQAPKHEGNRFTVQRSEESSQNTSSDSQVIDETDEGNRFSAEAASG